MLADAINIGIINCPEIATVTVSPRRQMQI